MAEKNIEELKEEIEKLKLELERLKKECKEEDTSKIPKEQVIEILDETEKIIKKTFSVLEGTIVGAIEGLKKNIKK